MNQPPVQQKLRKGVKQGSGITRLSLSKISINPSRYPLPKRPSQDSPRSQTIIATKMPNNITKHFVVNGNNNSMNNNTSQNQVIQNYLNQTMPMLTRSSVVQKNIHDKTTTIGECYKATRSSQIIKNHLRHNVIQKPITTAVTTTTATTTSIRNMRSLNSHNQSHGIITASAYKELKNGNVSW